MHLCILLLLLCPDDIFIPLSSPFIIFPAGQRTLKEGVVSWFVVCAFVV